MPRWSMQLQHERHMTNPGLEEPRVSLANHPPQMSVTVNSDIILGPRSGVKVTDDLPPKAGPLPELVPRVIGHHSIAVL